MKTLQDNFISLENQYQSRLKELEDNLKKNKKIKLLNKAKINNIRKERH